MDVLTPENVRLGARAAGKIDAIRQSGELLVDAGYVAAPYVEGMLARERVMSTYLGAGVAIPHGELGDLQSVYRTGVAVLQLPLGVEWEPGEIAYLVIGLAATPTSREHAIVLTNLLEVLQDPGAVRQLVHATQAMVIVERLTRSKSEQRSQTRWN